MTITPEDINELVAHDVRGPVLSLILRTDPRDPANTHSTQAWRVTLHTALRDLVARCEEEDGSREDRLALRRLAPEVEAELTALTPAERDRGVAWFVTADRSLDRRFSFHVPPSEDVVARWDDRPHVAPLLAIADRGRPVAIVLVSADAVRLLRWEQGRISEPDRSVFQLETGSWHDYRGPVAPNPARGQQSATHREYYEQRVAAWRERFYKDTGETLAQRIDDLGVDDVLIAGESGFAEAFEELVPQSLARRVVAGADENLIRAKPTTIGEHLEEAILDAWRTEVRQASEAAMDAARAGGQGAIGPDQTLQALASHRVERLVLDPDRRFPVADLGAMATEALRDAQDDLVAECAVELALASGARVTAVTEDDAPALGEAGGMLASLRY